MQVGDALTFQSAQPSGSQSYQNTAVGKNTMYNVTSGYGNSAIGAYSLNHLTAGNNNTGLGAGTLYLAVGGTNNTAVGNGALYSSVNGNDNVAVGYNAMQMIGSGTLSPNQCVAIGSGALTNVTLGSNSVCVGYKAGASVTTGGTNTLVGSSAGTTLTTGTSNCCFGNQSGSALTTGGYNVFVGQFTGGETTTGTNNTYVGNYAGNAGNFSYSTAIGQNATITMNNLIVLGTAAELTSIPGELSVGKLATFANGALINGTGDTTINSPLKTSEAVTFGIGSPILSIYSFTVDIPPSNDRYAAYMRGLYRTYPDASKLIINITVSNATLSSEMYVATVQQITTTQFQFGVLRLDSATGWNHNISCHVTVTQIP